VILRALKSAAAAALFFLAASQVPAAEPAARPELVEIFEAARALRQPPVVDGIPDYTAAAVDAQRRALASLRARFDRLDPGAWPVRDRVDYLLVRSDLDALDYGLNIYRATSRSPNFYISSISSFGMSSGATLSRLGQLVRQPPPFDRARAREILDHMAKIPRILEQAKRNLTEPTQEMSRWTLPALADAAASSRNFATGLAAHFPAREARELPAAAAKMGAAFADYRQWIEQRLPNMAHAQPVGRELYDWILRRIWLLPFDAEDIRRMGEQEYGRYLSFTAFEESRNRGLPPATRARTTADYATATQSDEQKVRSFLQSRDALTIPDFVGPYRRTLMPSYIQAFSLWAGLAGYSGPGNSSVKYAVPEDHPFAGTYWEAVMRIDPSTNIFHDGIPGHHFQGLVSSRHPSPIRAKRIDRFNSEGWATYWEETALQLGFYDERPRSRELLYNFLRLRALRVIVDVQMALGEMSAQEGAAALMSVPMDARTASEEADDFFAAPTGGAVYQIGKMQIERLLGERQRQLGAQFNLRQFHDDVVNAAWVPLELTRWEMIGESASAQRMLADRSPMPRPAAAPVATVPAAAAAKAASHIYASYCADCHGAKLEGASGPALRDGRWTQADAETALAARIGAGVPERGMPAWRGVIADSDIADLAAFVVARNSQQGKSAQLPDTFTTNLYDVRIEPVIDQGLKQPKSLAVLADGSLLVTEERGLRLVRDGTLVPEPIAGIPPNDSIEEIAVRATGASDAASWLYLTYLCSKACGHAQRHTYTLARGRLRDGRWSDNKTLFEYGDGDTAYGVSKLAFDDHGHVYFTLSAAEHPGQDPADLDAEMAKAQNLASYRGKVFRIEEDGRIPPDNPFVGKAGALPAIWSYGHRGLSGLTFDRARGELWATEHGPWGGDELNQIRGGANYGWPLVSFGHHYVGKHIDAAQAPALQSPIFHWTPSIGVSNVLVYDGAAFPKWRGQLFVGSLGARIGRTLYRFELKDTAARLYEYPSDAAGRVLRDASGTAQPRVPRYEEVLPDVGRIRDMRVGPEGYFYLLLERPERIVRVVPTQPVTAR
jgi:glucose/arabinose dehydrogenase